MNSFHRMIAVVACAAPLVAVAQTPSSGTRGAEPVEKKQTTETGQSTTYGKSGAKPDGAADKDKITKGDSATKATPAKPLDEASAAKTPAKEGSQSGPQK